MGTAMIPKLVGLALMSVAVSAVGVDNIAGTEHDLSDPARNDNGQICVYCHTPHNALQDVTKAVPPLWNKAFTTSTFSIYDSSTIDNPTGQPEGTSLACLSCHDGTLAIDSLINEPSGFTPNGEIIGGGANLGTDLSNDHPVSIGYSLAQDPSFIDPSVVVSTLPLFAGSQDTTYQVECASCHNVHDDTNSGFLRIPNTNSDLCLTCHIK